MGRKAVSSTIHVLAVVLVLVALPALVPQVPAAEWKPDRTVLPVQMPAPPKLTALDVHNVTTPPWVEVKAPAGAPNVVIILIDDMGFGVPATFGGPIPMPTLDRLAQNGLRFNNFHTTALCSPTRAALKSGRNHHVNNMGHRVCHWLPRSDRTDSQPCRSCRRDAPAQWLQHGRLRQMA
jgi:arylsulfatase